MARGGHNECVDREDMQLLFQEDNGRRPQSKLRLQSILSSVIALVAVGCLSVSVGCAQALGGHIPSFQLNFWRFIAQVVLVSPPVVTRSVPVLPEKKKVVWVGLLGICMTSGPILYYTAATHLPGGTLGGVTASLTLIFVALVNLVINRECIIHVSVAVAFCILGIVLVSQPEFIFGQSVPGLYNPVCGGHTELDSFNISQNATLSNVTTTIKDNVRGDETVGYLLAVAAAFVITSATFIAKIPLRETHVAVQVFWTAAVGSILSAIPMVIFETIKAPGCETCLYLLIGHVLGASGGFSAFLVLLQFVSPVVASIWLTLQVVILFVCQYTILESVYPGKGNAAEIIGALVILIGNLINPFSELFRGLCKIEQ